MKAVLLSIRPKWCEKIISGKKTVEIRKKRPKIQTPFKCYIYCTKPKELFDLSYDVKFGKVIGEFVCDWIESTPLWRLKGNTGFCAKRTEREEKLPQMACLSLDEIYRYIISENRLIYGWHISNLVIYDEPKELSEFYTALLDSDIRCKHLQMRYTINGIRYMKCTLQNCNCEFRRLGHQTDCDGYEPKNPRKPITRPPQSWCYVDHPTEKGGANG